MCSVERDYRNIKAQVWREKGGFLCCSLFTAGGAFILTMVSADKAECESSLVRTALRCLSMKDLALANGEAA